MRKIKTMALAGTVLMMSATVYADDTTQSSQEQQPGKKAGMMSPEKIQQSAVLNELHHLNQKEIRMGEMAQNKAQSPEVKEFAKTMVQDHKKLENTLRKQAQNQQVSLSDYKAAGYEEETMNNLEQLSGTEFDRAFMELGKLSHKQDIQELQATQDAVENQQIKDLVKNDVMPILQRHQKSADKIKLQPSQQAGEVSSDTSSQDVSVQDPSQDPSQQ